MLSPTPEEFREIMREGGWSVHGLAEALGVSPSTVARWRSGKHRAPAWSRPAIAGLEARGVPRTRAVESGGGRR